jgi:hypothetical protein
MVRGVKRRHDVNDVKPPRVPQSQDSVCVEEGKEKAGSGELVKWESFDGSA